MKRKKIEGAFSALALLLSTFLLMEAVSAQDRQQQPSCGKMTSEVLFGEKARYTLG